MVTCEMHEIVLESLLSGEFSIPLQKVVGWCEISSAWDIPGEDEGLACARRNHISDEKETHCWCASSLEYHLKEIKSTIF